MYRLGDSNTNLDIKGSPYDAKPGNWKLMYMPIFGESIDYVSTNCQCNRRNKLAFFDDWISGLHKPYYNNNNNNNNNNFIL